MRTSLALLLLTLAGASLLQAQSSNVEFDNGQWFDGKSFKRGPVYSVNGILSHRKPTVIGQMVDLEGGYVVPPFGDADARYSGTSTLQMLREGVFYGLVQDAPPVGASNAPRTVDLAFAAPPTQTDPRPDLIRILIGPNGATRAEAVNIAAQSYARKLRIAANIDSVAAYRAAVEADVDLILRLPVDTLSKADAAQTARQRIQVATAGASANKAANLRLLKSAGVELVIAGDGEALQLHSLNVFSNLQLLKLWSEVTPRAIFPTRRIGYLRDSYEASFVVLRQNPLKDFPAAVQQIALRFKQGRLLAL